MTEHQVTRLASSDLASTEALVISDESPVETLARWLAGCRQATSDVDVIEVRGEGAFADCLRRWLRPATTDGRRCIVVAAGLTSVDDALVDCGPGGVVVVATPSATDSITIDAYRHLHKPCATLRFADFEASTTDALDVAAGELVSIDAPDSPWRLDVSSS